MSNNFPSLRILIMILFCSLFCIFNCYSQVGQAIEWQNTIGADDYENLNAIQQTDDGGYILGGYSSSGISGDKTESNWDTTNISTDYWIVKTDAMGNIQWDNTIGGDQTELFTSLQQTSDGGYILGGISYSGASGDKSENNNGETDLWIVKIDATGNIQWENTIGGSLSENFSSIQKTSDGGYIILSSSYSGISGDKTENNWDMSGYGLDYWVIKIDALGNIEWQNDIGGFEDDYPSEIHQTNDGGYIIGGTSQSDISGDKTENNFNGTWDCWIIKTDASGNIEWQNTIGGNNSDYLLSIQQTSDGGYFFGGSSYSNISGDKTENSNGDYDYWIVKTDASGNLEWQNTIGGSGEDWLNSIQQTTDGGYVLGGQSSSDASGDKTENSQGQHDYWVVKTDSAGNIQWQNTIGGSDEDRLMSIQQTDDDGYILGGYSWSNISGHKTENTHGYADYWIVKLTHNFSAITGNLFIDINSNGSQDAGEVSLPDKRVTESNTGRFAFSNPPGFYAVTVLDTGSFSVYPETVNYYNPVPANQSAYFSSLQQTDSLNDFGFQPAGVFNDLRIHITPMGSFRAGFITNYAITYENIGTTTLSPDIIFFPDSNLIFDSASVTPSSVTSDSVTWNLGPLAPYYTGSILVTVKVDSSTLIGTAINSEAHIEPLANDENTADNLAVWNSVTTGSSDPNAILVDRQTILTTELASPPYLEYIIYFQNTGNDTAFNVSVQNKIPGNLDVSSFEFVASSHPMSITYATNEQLMTFTFDNILLPDSNINEMESHGFVRYRVKPLSTLAAGDSIMNTASIYFDFNASVQTNTAVTEIVLPTNSPHLESQSLSFDIFPNPATDEITIQSTQQVLEEGLLTIYDLFGRIIFQSDLSRLNREIHKAIAGQIKIDVSDFRKGVYFVEMTTGENSVAQKFVKL